MAHFAYVLDGVVQKVHVLANAVITDEDGVEHESLGQEFLADLHGYEPDQLIQCSYNGNQRGVYPGPGYIYDAENNIFTPPKPFDSWVLNEYYRWQAPKPLPNDAETVPYVWDEDAGDWVVVDG